MLSQSLLIIAAIYTKIYAWPIELKWISNQSSLFTFNIVEIIFFFGKTTKKHYFNLLNPYWFPMTHKYLYAALLWLSISFSFTSTVDDKYVHSLSAALWLWKQNVNRYNVDLVVWHEINNNKIGVSRNERGNNVYRIRADWKEQHIINTLKQY